MASLADVSRAIMNSARAAPKLDAATERALLAKHQADGDKAAVDRIAAANLRVVLSVANKLRGYGLPLDDLVQEGCCGVMLAALKFDTTRDTPFGAYARLWAKHEMHEFILRNWSIVRLPLQSIEQKLFFKMRQLRIELSRDPEVSSAAVSAEIASRFGVSVQDVEVLQARMGGGDFSLNAPAFADEDGSAEWGDFLIGDMPSPDDMIEDDQCAADLRFAMQALDDQERLIVEQRWLTEDIAPLVALAEWFEISVPKVRKIEIGAIEKLRRTMFERRSRPNPVYA